MLPLTLWGRTRLVLRRTMYDSVPEWRSIRVGKLCPYVYLFLMLLPCCVRFCTEEINSCNIHPDFLQIVPEINFGTKELRYYTNIYAFCNAPFRKDKILSTQLAYILHYEIGLSLEHLHQSELWKHKDIQIEFLKSTLHPLPPKLQTPSKLSL
jgi:hypothetical protein